MEQLELLVGALAGSQQFSEIVWATWFPEWCSWTDLRTAVGALLVPKGFEVTEAFLERLRNFGPVICWRRFGS